MAGAAARRYARAIFDLAVQEGQVEEWTRRLAEHGEALSQPELRALLTNPSIAVQRRQEVAASILEPRVGAGGVNLARLLVAANRVGEVDGIAEEVGLLADEAAGRVRASATSAVPLERSETDKLVAALSKELGREVRLDVSVDPAIIGGLVLQIGDRVIDASVATRLHQLRRQLAGT